MKKSIVLSGTDGKRPIIATLEQADGIINGIINARGTACIDDGNTFTFCEIENGRFSAATDITYGFNLGVFDEGLIYFGYGGCKNGKGKMLNAFKREKQKVNKAYDDEAIATDNYFALEGEINPTSPSVMRDKGDFFILNDATCGQFFTSYPQCVREEKENEKNGKHRLYNEAGGTCRTGETEAKAASDSRPCNKNEASDSTERHYRKKVTEGLDKLFIRFPREKSLEMAIRGSTFVRIAYTDEKFYVVGKTVYMGEDEYVIFGIPHSDDTPTEITDIAYRVPTANGDYYLIYQSAVSGELIKSI